MEVDMPDLDKVAKHTLTLPNSVYTALCRSAEQQELEPSEVIQNLIIDHVIQAGTLDEGAQAQLQAYRKAVGHAVEVARQRLRDGAPVETLTADTFKACADDAEWRDNYRLYVQDDIFKNGNPRKGPINREIGYRIRAAVGAEVMKDADGRPVLRKVLGSVIQSYTPFSDFDRTKL
jgi:hypothetical protein